MVDPEAFYATDASAVLADQELEFVVAAPPLEKLVVDQRHRMTVHLLGGDHESPAAHAAVLVGALRGRHFYGAVLWSVRLVKLVIGVHTPNVLVREASQAECKVLDE